MGEKIVIQGNEAVGLAAIAANCGVYCGYPITPQNEVPEWFSREFPKAGRIFLQSGSEIASTFLLFGALAAGVRAMTSTASPGWGLMQEGVSHMVNAELPGVILLVQRGGPGQGTTRHSQMDYASVTRGGGQGSYKNIVLAPASVQEVYDFIQLAFHLADKYRNPVIVLSDAYVNQGLELLEPKTIDFGPLPEKDWTLKGKASHKDGKPRFITSAHGLLATSEYPTYISFLQHLASKYKKMESDEVRYVSYQIDDADLVIVAYGYTSRVSREAMNRARSQGLKVGLIRPQTLWPFPIEVIRQKAGEGAKFLMVEDGVDGIGGLIKDVRIAVQGKSEVGMVTALDRHNPDEWGAILPGKVSDKIDEMLSRKGIS